MSNLTDIVDVVRTMNLDELQELERLVRAARRDREKGPPTSALDLPPLAIGRMIGPLSFGDLLGEMLDDVRT